MLALELTQDGEPVLVGQLDVHHHEVRHLLGHGLDSLGPGRGFAHRTAGILEEVGQEIAYLLLVIDEENRTGGRGQSASPSGSGNMALVSESLRCSEGGLEYTDRSQSVQLRGQFRVRASGMAMPMHRPPQSRTAQAPPMATRPARQTA